MKTLKIKYTPNYNFKIIGISSTEVDYKLAWSLSKKIYIEFYKLKDIERLRPKSETKQMFSIYGNVSDNYEESNIILVSNKSQNGYLLDELKNIDFFIIIRETNSIDTEQLIKSMRDMKEIFGVYKLSINEIKSKERIAL